MNDEIAEDGTMGGDEDDHDQQAITVAQGFDLALVKTLATGQSATVNAGDTVDFTITVHNQGTITATNTEITDYVPADMTYDATLNTAAATGNAVDWSAGATYICLLYTSPSPRDATLSRMPSSA